ncbi:MAG: type II toxin-antitoxin system HicB family antitoxin [Bacteroidota bacterium]|nr:type II toxin-antitoxin system HicB family antitoxin [Bacteroidota bacterium]MDP4230682.1 type II toxin-antitoxin system HicB family antitoxin [Bacteroidota bacterium]MDP4235089.1 type II toxin-antitoxin system HicB family antitoxin [Bacteroidota bacterium]
MKYYNYTIVIEPDEDAFHAYVPALKGCHSIGDTPEEAKTNIKEAIELYLESLIAPILSSL